MDTPSVPISSTYAEDFRTNSSPYLPPLLEFQPNRFNKNQDHLAPRCYPIAQPIVPHRKRDSNIPIGPGFSTLLQIGRDDPTSSTTPSKKEFDLQTINTNTSRAVVANDLSQSPTKKSSCQGPDIEKLSKEKLRHVPRAVVKELVKFGHYTPSSEIASCFIKKPKVKSPITPAMRREFWQKNFHRDSIVNSGRILGQSNSKPENWQTVGCMWDKLQERKATTVSQCMEPLVKERCRLLSRPRCAEKINRSFYTLDCSNNMSSNILGYSGYQPRLPISTVKMSAGNRAQTMSNTTYRQHPKWTYKLPVYGQKAPMSCTVTLTDPYNPFN